MDALASLDEHEVDALLTGQAPPGTDLAAVAEVVRTIRASASREQVPSIDPSLRAQLDRSPPPPRP